MFANYDHQNLDYVILREWVRDGFESRNLSIAAENLSAIHLLDVDSLSDHELIDLNTNKNAGRIIRDLAKTTPGKIDWVLAFMYVDGIHDLAVPLIESFKNAGKLNVVRDIVGAISSRPEAIDIIRANLEYACGNRLSENPAAADLLRSNPSMINWAIASTNPSMIDLLKENMDKVSRHDLSINPAAGEVADLIEWTIASGADNMLDLIESNLDRVDWTELSSNPNPRAVKILAANRDKIDRVALSSNHSAIELIKEVGYDADRLSSNLGAMEILETIQDQIDWHELTSNPGITTYDYARIRRERKQLGEEIHMSVYHPSRIGKWIEAGNELEAYMM